MLEFLLIVTLLMISRALRRAIRQIEQQPPIEVHFHFYGSFPGGPGEEMSESEPALGDNVIPFQRRTGT